MQIDSSIYQCVPYSHDKPILTSFETNSLPNIRLVSLENTILASVDSSSHQYTKLISTAVTSLESAIDGRLKVAAIHSQDGESDEGHAHFLSVLDDCLQIFGQPSRINGALPGAVSPQVKPVAYNQFESRPVSPLGNWGAYSVPSGQPYFPPQQYQQQQYFVPQQYQQGYLVPPQFQHYQQFQQPQFVDSAFQYGSDFPALLAAPYYQQ